MRFIATIAIVFFLIFFSGCVSIGYNEKGFSYYRFGNQELIDIKVERSGIDDSVVKVEIGHQMSASEIADIVLKILLSSENSLITEQLFKRMMEE